MTVRTWKSGGVVAACGFEGGVEDAELAEEAEQGGERRRG